jgi:4,5-DOPA dioxygenase extradiol
MDTVYISHGSPMMAIDESIPARKFLKTWQQIFKERPKAILVISGHWDTKEPTVNVVNRNDTIYDFYGFPKSMYKVLLIYFSLKVFCFVFICQRFFLSGLVSFQVD